MPRPAPRRQQRLPWRLRRQLLQRLEHVGTPTDVLGLRAWVGIVLVDFGALGEPSRAALAEEFVGEAWDVLEGRVCERVQRAGEVEAEASKEEKAT